MNRDRIEFPAYNIFFRQGGTWILHGEPVIGKTYQDVLNIATGILLWSDETSAVRIYGIFQCQQTFIKELSKKEFQEKDKETGEDRLRKAMNADIELCNDSMGKGCVYSNGAFAILSKIRTILSNALSTSSK